MKTLPLLLFLSLVLAARLPADPAPEGGIPPEMQELLRGSRGSDWGAVESDAGREEEVAAYIRANWKYLMEHIEDVPSMGETKLSAAGLIATACEELPPEEYLDFLDAFLNLYSQGVVPDNVLITQLHGVGRKNYFITVNHAHPRVQDFLKRTKGLAPKENERLHELIEELARGKNSDMYYANASEDEPPPETLPGIKLRRPFESMIGEIHRNRKESDEATRRERSAQATAETKGDETAGSGAADGAWKTWGLASALVLLLLTAWKTIFKPRAPVSRSR